MNTTKMAVRVIADICRRRGMQKVVFSPGSRSAPLYIAFSQIPEMECIVIPDERVAGYFALGMSQQTGKPVGVVCTSGTAVLNLAPAYYEAYYQEVSIVCLTADRPEGAEQRMENQAINQQTALDPGDGGGQSINGDETDKMTIYDMAQTFDWTLYTMTKGTPGPDHLNIRMDEPLYELTDAPLIDFEFEEREIRKDEMSTRKIREEAASYSRKMILVGVLFDKPEFTRRLTMLSHRNDFVIVRETTSNLPVKNSVANIDACLSMISEEDKDKYAPEVVIRVGKQVVSKKVIRFIQNAKSINGTSEEEYIDYHFAAPEDADGFEIYDYEQIQILDALLKSEEKKDSNYKSVWMDLSVRARKKTEEFLSQTPFSDLKVFETLIQSFPDEANIHYGNSTPVRYSNLIKHQTPGLTVNSNRGTSGIDGCISTAAGAAYVNGKMTIVIVGDISFFYDSNSLWNNYLSPNLRIIIINNSGGNIFRLIDGPSKLKGFEKFFETQHGLTAKHIAYHHNLPYYYCDSQKGMEEILKSFYEPHSGKPAILEIKTDGEKSAEVYRNYFDYLKKNQ